MRQIRSHSLAIESHQSPNLIIFCWTFQDMWRCFRWLLTKQSGTECKSRISRRWVGVNDGPHGARLLSTSTVAWQDEMNIWIWWFGNDLDSGLNICVLANWTSFDPKDKSVCLLHFLFLPHTGLFWRFVVAFHFSWHTRHVNVDSFHLWSRKSIQSALAAVADERRSTA